MHTNCSDGQLSPLCLIEQSVKIGLRGLAITDHHSIRGYQIAQDWLEAVRETFPLSPQHLPYLWTGIEITSELLNVEVHILGYGFNPQHEMMTPYLQGTKPEGNQRQAENIIKALHAAGGLVVLAHPYRYHRPAPDLIAIAADLGIDGVEAYYAYGNPKPWHPSPRETEKVLELSRFYGLFATCGTDTHGKDLLSRL